jgi:3-oxoacyl-[acyl-carrier protein] reductase
MEQVNRMTIEVSFNEKVVLITGGATGIGLATAQAFGEHGAQIALTDLPGIGVHEASNDLAGRDINCHAFEADVRDASGVSNMVAEVVSQFGRIDILVANAGVYPVSEFLDLTENEWDRVIDTNVKGVFLSCQAVAKAMVSARQEGQIITISSGAANRAIPGWSHYCTSKAGVVMLTRAMALELARYRIRVNSVLPGYIDVDLGGAHLDPEYKATARSSIPLGRPGTPRDIANAVLMLASPLAEFVTGAVLTVDGGSSTGNPRLRPA